MKTPLAPRRRAFTLIELLVVIAIIGILVALLLPAVQAAREAARRTECSNNLRQIGLSMHMHEDQKNSLPVSMTHHSSDQNQSHSWLVMILPYMEQRNLYNEFDFTVRMDQTPREIRSTSLGWQTCPARRSAPAVRGSGTGTGDKFDGAVSDYAGVGGTTGDYGVNGDGPLIRCVNFRIQEQGSYGSDPVRGVATWVSRTSLGSLTKGTSNTLLVGEKHQNSRRFLEGWQHGDSNCYLGDSGGGRRIKVRRAGTGGYGLVRDPAEDSEGSKERFGSFHPGICLFVMADGAVQNISASASEEVLAYLASRSATGAYALPTN